MPGTIAIAQNIRETLECCLQVNLNETTLDSYDKETFCSYEEAAKDRGVPVSVYVSETKQKINERLKFIKGLAETLPTLKDAKDKVLLNAELCESFSEFLWDYWDFLPKKLRGKLSHEFSKLFSTPKKTWMSPLTSRLREIKEKTRLLIPSWRSGLPLFQIQRKTTIVLLQSLWEAIEKESGIVTDEALVRLSHDIESVKDLHVQQLLKAELQQVSSLSDLNSLRETVYLFRSKKNGERLQSALKEASSETLESSSLDALREECGFGKGTEKRQ